MSEIPTQACWRAADAQAIFVTEALEGHEGIFLATHTPTTGFAVSGSLASDLATPDERALLQALAAPGRRHAFCVVQGEPGSGKSHLVRWLSVNWPQGNDIKLLLQRADGSLEGALRQLQERLPPGFKDLFDRLGQRHRATLEGRINNFLSNLANALDPDHFDPPLKDAAWCREHCPSDLLNHREVRRKWQGPARILRLLEGAEQQRNSASANFDLFDIEDLAASCGSVYNSGVLPQTERLANRLIHEATEIKAHRENGWTAAEIEREPPGSLKASVALMRALNLRRNDAIQNVLGVSAEGLKTLFRQVREALFAREQRLVLLLEDITSWEGVDDSLIDVLVTNAETRGADGDLDMCPLISVVGVTPAYYDGLHGNYRGRITHELRLGDAREIGGLQDVSTLRTPSARLSFIARYLAAVRVGVDSLAGWREELRSNEHLSPPNKCDLCPYLDDCHRVFGEHDGIGLYPFTADAFEHMFKALKEHDNGMTWKTPRGILQAILTPNLSQPQSIEEGTFPTALLESNALEPDRRQLSPRLRDRIELAVPEPQERARMQRLLAYWGDRERADTWVTDDGDLAFAGVRRAVFEAFALPWIGDDAGAAEGTPALVDALPAIGTELEPKPPEVRPSDVAPKHPSSTRAVKEPPSRRRTPTKSELERLRGQLRQWEDTKELANPSEWNKSLFTLVEGLDPRRIRLDPQVFKRIMTPEQVKIEGTGPSGRNYLLVKPEKWLLLGLEAYIALRLDSAMSPGDAEYHRHNLASLMRQLERLASRYADRRLTLLTGGSRWAPAGVLAQLLLARGWLRGIVAPGAPPATLLEAVLSDERGADSDPVARCEPWRQLLTATNGWHERLRAELRGMVALSQGGGSNSGFVDASKVVDAIVRLEATLKFDSVPAKGSDTGVREYDKLRELIETFQDALGRIARIELAQIQGRAATLRDALRGRSIRAHLARVDRAIETVAEHLPAAAPDQVRQWKSAYDSLSSRLSQGADRGVEDLLFELSEDGSGAPAGGAPLVGWLAQAPCRDLDELRRVAQLGDQVCGNLLDHVRDCVHEGSRSGSMEEIRAIGRSLQAAIQPAEREQRIEVA
jgi:hypothetical protein